MRARIVKRIVDSLPVGEILSDTEIRGFTARRLSSGQVTYGYRYRDRTSRRQRWIGLGVHGSITAEEARTLAKKRAGEVADARDPLSEREAARIEAEKERAAQANTVDTLLDTFVARYVQKNRLKRTKEVERIFDRYVRPRIGKRPIYALRRRDIVAMLDAIEDKNGPVMADRVLAHVRKAFNWQAARDDAFLSPIVLGMARTKPKERARKRILSDDEICEVWFALDAAKVPPPFPNLVRTLLLTAQRRDEVARMAWEEIDDVWIIPAARYKTGNPNVVPLTAEIWPLLGQRKKKGYVFSTTGGERPFSGFSKAKTALDATIAETRKAEAREPMAPWVLHDLRRTARSLMSRTGVASDIAERVIGHTIPGVRGIYDRYAYHDEKTDALERLSKLVRTIVRQRDGHRTAVVA